MLPLLHAGSLNRLMGDEGKVKFVLFYPLHQCQELTSISPTVTAFPLLKGKLFFIYKAPLIFQPKAQKKMKALNSYSLKQFFLSIAFFPPKCCIIKTQRGDLVRRSFSNNCLLSFFIFRHKHLVLFSLNRRCLVQWEALGINEDGCKCRHLFQLLG